MIQKVLSDGFPRIDIYLFFLLRNLHLIRDYHQVVYQIRMKFFDRFQTHLNKTVNLNQNFYREKYSRIWSVCEDGGRQAWKDICPIQPYHVSWWRGRLEENAFLGAGRGKTRHRKAGLRKIAPNPNQVLMWPNRNKMAIILGDTFGISEPRRPIWVKLWGWIEFNLKLCKVIIFIYDKDLKPGNRNFPESPTIIPCNIFLRFLIFPKLKHFQIDSKSFRIPQAWIKTPKFAANRPRGCPAVFLPTPKMNAILPEK